MEDATCRQVQALHPESSGCSDSTPVHKITNQPQYHQGRAAYSGYRGRGGPHRGGRPFQGNWPQSRQDYSMTPMCEHCGKAPHNSRQECRALGMEYYTCHKFGHLSHLCKQNTESDKTEVKHYMKNRDNEHIRPLWIAQSENSQIHQTDCKVDTGAGCNILPVHRAKELFGKE